jgi:hypothetical protein
MTEAVLEKDKVKKCYGCRVQAEANSNFCGACNKENARIDALLAKVKTFRDSLAIEGYSPLEVEDALIVEACR